MINPEVAERLETEIDRIRTIYDPKTTEDLEKIAREEYGVVRVVKTPLVCDASTVITYGGEFYIFYDTTFTPSEMYALGHEIGHIVAGHFNGHHPDLIRNEQEADYFSQRLNNVHPSKFWLYLFIDAELSFVKNFLNIFQREREVERLTKMGVYHLLE